ncbi:hypothetical protein BGW37DRAFT_316913 [Umbelopsis sp. PMI_123]|nr:hypothetical protein BGW37DRAFT_316913 [Umbelopsis sp. PMI_123]
MQCPNSPSMRSTARSNFEPRTPSTLMSRLVIHSPDAVRQRFNNADRPSTDLQKRLLHCSSSPKPSHPNLNMFLSNESKRIRMERNILGDEVPKRSPPSLDTLFSSRSPSPLMASSSESPEPYTDLFNGSSSDEMYSSDTEQDTLEQKNDSPVPESTFIIWEDGWSSDDLTDNTSDDSRDDVQFNHDDAENTPPSKQTTQQTRTDNYERQSRDRAKTRRLRRSFGVTASLSHDEEEVSSPPSSSPVRSPLCELSLEDFYEIDDLYGLELTHKTKQSSSKSVRFEPETPRSQLKYVAYPMTPQSTPQRGRSRLSQNLQWTPTRKTKFMRSLSPPRTPHRPSTNHESVVSSTSSPVLDSHEGNPFLAVMG